MGSVLQFREETHNITTSSLRVGCSHAQFVKMTLNIIKYSSSLNLLVFCAAN